jgi:hypothetical protein
MRDMPRAEARYTLHGKRLSLLALLAFLAEAASRCPSSKLLLYCCFTAALLLLLLGRYPMNLAETASIFFETVVGDRLVALASTPQVLRNSALREPS